MVGHAVAGGTHQARPISGDNGSHRRGIRLCREETGKKASKVGLVRQGESVYTE